MASNVYKLKTLNEMDVFSYRDEANEERVVELPSFWEFTEQEVEDWLNL